MCYGCYEEYGKPELVTPEIRRASELCRQLYEFSCVGGNCHIVTDDWNLEDHHIAFCVDQVAAGGWFDERTGETHNDDPAQLAVEKELLNLLLPMSIAERASALAMWDEFFKPSEPL